MPSDDSPQALTLFDPEDYFRPVPDETVELELSESSETGPPQTEQLCYTNQQLGAMTELAFEVEIQRLGGSFMTPRTDPSAGVAADRWVQFPGWWHAISAQVRGRTLRDGNAQFDIGPKPHAGTRKKYNGRANLFVLAVWSDERLESKILHWYLIPAARLRKRTTVTITPGKWSLRRRKDWLEPERFRDNWAELLRQTPRGSRSSADCRDAAVQASVTAANWLPRFLQDEFGGDASSGG